MEGDGEGERQDGFYNPLFVCKVGVVTNENIPSICNMPGTEPDI